MITESRLADQDDVGPHDAIDLLLEHRDLGPLLLDRRAQVGDGLLVLTKLSEGGRVRGRVRRAVVADPAAGAPRWRSVD